MPVGTTSFLVEVSAFDPVAGVEVVHRFSDGGFTTLPTDNPPNADYEPRLKVPADYTRTMFADGTTSGNIEVGVGVIELLALDGGIDPMIGHAFDGRKLRVFSVNPDNPVYADAVLLFDGTTEQVVFTWTEVSIRMRDRLAELDKPLQTMLFAGTTISGGLNEAEGTPDGLKGQQKPLTWGAPPMVTAVASNTFNNIFDLGQNGLQSVASVWDKGVSLGASVADYPTVTALKAASIAAGRYATCLALGLIRTGSSPSGTITAAPVEGGNAAARTAGQIARRMLLRMGMVEGVDFLTSDITALDAANSAVIGYWTGTEEVTARVALGKVLNSIGATIVPDRLGRFRMFRMGIPSGTPVMTFTQDECLEVSESGIQRLVTGDDGKGVPAWRITVQYGHNWTVMSRNELDAVNATAAFKTFAENEWRTAVSELAATKDVHKLATELTFETYLVVEADATAEAARLLGMHGVARERYKAPAKSDLAQGIDLGSVIEIKLPRFQLDASKIFTVIGLAEDFEANITTVDVWG